MRGLAMLEIGQVGWIEKERPTAGAYDAIVRPLSVAPCSSDIHVVYSGIDFGRNNIILGHEVVAEVVEVGCEVKDFKPGDRVIVPPITPDWRSPEVQWGYHQHAGGFAGGYKLSVTKDGAFGEYFNVNDADMNMAHLPEGIPLESAIMIPDVMNTGFYSAEVANIEWGATVAVLGIGPIGLMAIAGAKLKGAGRIIAVGSRTICVEAAKFYGATDIVNYKCVDVAEEIMNLTENKGVDAVIIAGGDAGIVRAAIKIAKIGATISNVNFFLNADSLPIPLVDWGFGMAQKTIKGSLCPGGRVRMERLIDLVRYGRVDLSKLVTHVFYGFEGIEKAFYAMRDKPEDLIKSIAIIDELK